MTVRNDEREIRLTMPIIIVGSILLVIEAILAGIKLL